jgi:hypothetical protein
LLTLLRKWRADLVKDGWFEREWVHEAFNLGSWALCLTAGIMLAQVPPALIHPAAYLYI